MGKWIAGIAASVVAAVVGYFLIGPGGVFNPKPQSSGPQVRITAFNGPNYSSVGEVPQRIFTVSNIGDEFAQQCSIFWRPLGTNDHPLLSEQFSLAPNESKDLTMRATSPYSTADVFDEVADIFCRDGARSPPVTRVVNTHGLSDR